MSETTAELIARARCVTAGGAAHLFLIEELADAIEAAEAERDAAWGAGYDFAVGLSR